MLPIFGARLYLQVVPLGCFSRLFLQVVLPGCSSQLLVQVVSPCCFFRFFLRVVSSGCSSGLVASFWGRQGPFSLAGPKMKARGEILPTFGESFRGFPSMLTSKWVSSWFLLFFQLAIFGWHTWEVGGDPQVSTRVHRGPQGSVGVRRGLQGS